jgi:threonine/homoserine/homoserine lactone efflux protein
MDMFAFLCKVVIISLSGVMAPGVITAATIALGAKDPKAGAVISIGHGMVEIPLIILIVLGLSSILKSTTAQIAIGIVGGLVLMFIAVTMLNEYRKPPAETKPKITGPLTAGILLTASNPYFLLWWASVGLNLTISASQLGMVAFVLFAVVHWLCDLIWLSILSWASYKGSTILGPRNQRMILAGCAVILILFSIKFIYDAAVLWLS